MTYSKEFIDKVIKNYGNDKRIYDILSSGNNDLLARYLCDSQGRGGGIAPKKILKIIEDSGDAKTAVKNILKETTRFLIHDGDNLSCQASVTPSYILDIVENNDSTTAIDEIKKEANGIIERVDLYSEFLEDYNSQERQF